MLSAKRLPRAKTGLAKRCLPQIEQALAAVTLAGQSGRDCNQERTDLGYKDSVST
jgi:hypothetical protein